MQAVVVSEFGGPERLVPTEVPDPEVGPGEVLIDVAAIDVLWVETMIRSGAGGTYFGVTPPYVPGNAVAGRVRRVGAGVEPGRAGEAVVARTGGGGGSPSRWWCPPPGCPRSPTGWTWPPRPRCCTTGPRRCSSWTRRRSATATRCSSGGQWRAGHRVGAAGQGPWCAGRGGGPGRRKLARLRELGLGPVIDSETPDWVEQARRALGGAGADVVLDNIGGAVGEAAFGLVAPGGRFSAHGRPSGRFASIDPEEARARGVTVRDIRDVQVAESERTPLTDRALGEAAAGRISPVIGQTFPLAKAADAHAAIEARTVFGSTLLVP